MNDTEKTDRLGSLEARIAEARRKRAGGDRAPSVSDDLSGNLAGLAFRIGVELVAAVGVAAGIGWLLDRWLGTRPWMMVAFFFLGAAAGMLNVYRAVGGFGSAVGYRRPGDTGRYVGRDVSDRN